MKTQTGYINIDFAPIFAALLIIGAVLGVVGYAAISWAWPFIKAWIHAITA